MFLLFQNSQVRIPRDFSKSQHHSWSDKSEFALEIPPTVLQFGR